jgi:ParB/RepB/Spo0J family partition protein
MEAVMRLHDAVNYEVKTIALTGIREPVERARHLRTEVIDQIAESFRQVGQLQPIIVQPNSDRDVGYMLIAGLHRLRAARVLKWGYIKCHVYMGLAAFEAEEIELRENLDRGDLSTAEADMHMARLIEIRKEQYKLKAGNPHGKAKANSSQIERNYKKESNTAKVVAKETGRSAASVGRSGTRVKKVKRIADVVGTSLDKGVEIDALARLSPSEQAALIDKALAGEQVSARGKKQPPSAPPPTAVRKITTAEDVLAEAALGIKRKSLPKHQSSAGLAEKSAALRAKYGPAPDSEEALRRRSPEARLTRMFDELALELCNARATLDRAVEFIHAQHIDKVRIPIRVAQELSLWEQSVSSLRKCKTQEAE